jgi:hypothetical protein
MKTYKFVLKKANKITEDFLDSDGKQITKEFTKSQAEAYWVYNAKHKPTQNVYMPADTYFVFDENGKLVEKQVTSTTKKVTE